MKHVPALTLLLLLFCSTTAQSSRVALIFLSGSSTDSTAAFSFGSLLHTAGYATTRIGTDNIVTTDFSAYDAIIIGNGTGQTNTWAGSTSMFSAKLTAISNSGKPIIGVGDGGYAFFGKLSLAIGYPNGTHSTISEVKILDRDHPVFNFPNDIRISKDSVVQLYTASCASVDISRPSVIKGITFLGEHPTEHSYYELIHQTSRYILWGYSGSPATMTQDGKDIFVNVVEFMIRNYMPNSAAIIHGAATDWALDFADLLESHGMNVQLISIDSVDYDNLAPHDIIIIDPKASYGWDWSNMNGGLAIRLCHKPVLGIGRGGTGLFQNVAISLNWDNSWSTGDIYSTAIDDTKLYCVDPSMSIYKTPRPITIPADSIIQLYNQSDHIGEYLPSLGIHAVMIGREPSNSTHFTLAVEDTCFLWGFTNPPASMTQTGKDLFYNIVADLIHPKFSTSIKAPSDVNSLPREFSLSHNYPNPFNPSTSIEYSVRKSGLVTLTIFNIMGQEVATLVDGIIPAGTHRVTWQADGFPSGVYFCRMQAGAFSVSERLVLLK